MTPPRRLTALSLSLLLLASISACSDGESSSGPPSSHESHSVEGHEDHGDDGDEATDGDDGEQDGWNDADAAFLEQMIPHHDQALTMAELAESRAVSPQVRSMADRIEAAQGPEILVMADWLTDRGLEVPDHAHHEMEGMLTDEQLAALSEADGAEFDRLFLDGMIQHHEGAVEMALTVLSDGEDQLVNELANDVNASQSAEIARMQAILSDL